MASLDGEGVQVIIKLKGENFNIWKFKLKVVLDFVDLWSKQTNCGRIRGNSVF